MSLQLKPADKLLHKYQLTLREFRHASIEHESATRSAFQNLLAELARRRKWRLIPEHPYKLTPGTTIRPDAALRDESSFVFRGPWPFVPADIPSGLRVSDRSGSFAKWRVFGIGSGMLEGILGGLGTDSGGKGFGGGRTGPGWAGVGVVSGVIFGRGEGLGAAGGAVFVAGQTKEAERSGNLGTWRGARLRPLRRDPFGPFGLVARCLREWWLQAWCGSCLGLLMAMATEAHATNSDHR